MAQGFGDGKVTIMEMISNVEFVVIGQGSAILYCCDWLQYRDRFATAELGAVVTDPPYGMAYKSRHNTNGKDPESWGRWRRDSNFAPIHGDEQPFDPSPLLGLSHRLAICGGNHFAHLLPPSRGWIVWDKLDGLTPSHQADLELVWTNQNRPARLFRWLWRGIIRKGKANVSNSPKLHPNQKPVELMTFIIEYLGVPHGTRIFDPYMGSGSTGEASLTNGYTFVGCEIDREHFETARARLTAVAQQPTLGFPLC